MKLCPKHIFTNIIHWWNEPQNTELRTKQTCTDRASNIPNMGSSPKNQTLNSWSLNNPKNPECQWEFFGCSGGGCIIVSLFLLCRFFVLNISCGSKSCDKSSNGRSQSFLKSIDSRKAFLLDDMMKNEGKWKIPIIFEEDWYKDSIFARW